MHLPRSRGLVVFFAPIFGPNLDAKNAPTSPDSKLARRTAMRNISSGLGVLLQVDQGRTEAFELLIGDYAGAAEPIQTFEAVIDFVQ